MLRDEETCYRIEFDPQGGESKVDAYSAARGTSLGELPLPTKANYKFLGWYTHQVGGVVVGATDLILSDAVYYAHWEWDPTNVVFSSNAAGRCPLRVEGAWVCEELDNNFGAGTSAKFLNLYGADLAAALLMDNGKKDSSGTEMSVWHDYVAGTDPTDTNSVFKVLLDVQNGVPVLRWDPDLNAHAIQRKYTIWGKTNLIDACWHTPTNEMSRFFKVEVSMPESDAQDTDDEGGSSGGGDPSSPESTSGLIHRWSFNGDLNDSVGSSDAKIVGNGTLTETECMLPGGDSGRNYVRLGQHLLPTNGSPITVEIWATHLSDVEWDRIIEFGSMPDGYDFTVYNTNCFSTNNFRICWNGNTCFSDIAATQLVYLDSKLSSNVKYHIAVVLQPNGTGFWQGTYYIQNADTGEMLSSKTFTSTDVDWSPSMIGRTECLLGQALTCWNSTAKASYDEVRIWNVVLSESDIDLNGKAGPDLLSVK